jgi:hypothetical protein
LNTNWHNKHVKHIQCIHIHCTIMSKNFCCELSHTSNKDTDDSTFSIRHVSIIYLLLRKSTTTNNPIFCTKSHLYQLHCLRNHYTTPTDNLTYAIHSANETIYGQHPGITGTSPLTPTHTLYNLQPRQYAPNELVFVLFYP